MEYKDLIDDKGQENDFLKVLRRTITSTRINSSNRSKSYFSPYSIQLSQLEKQMEIHLKHQGLYRVIMGMESEPIGIIEKRKWCNRCDEAFGTLCMSISPYLLFHVESCTIPNEIQTTVESPFGKKDALICFQLENELIGLNPNNFDRIQKFFTKRKSLRLQLKQCKVEKEDSLLILSILAKLMGNTHIFHYQQVNFE